MFKFFHLILVVGVLILQTSSQIQIDFNSTNATLFPNKNLTLSFKVFGGKEPYTLNYGSIPRDWTSRKNILVIPDYRQIVKTGWRFDVIVKDSSNNSFSQTVMISFDNEQIIIFPVTLQRAAKDTAENNKNVLRQPSFLNNIINRYPGKRSYGFDIDYFDNTVITPKLIETAQARYIPERDAQPRTQNKIQLDNALSRLQRATKLIANIMTKNDEISKGIKILQNQVPIQQKNLKQLKKSTFECQSEVDEFQNVQAKFTNAMDDRDIKIKQGKQLMQQDNKALIALTNNISLLIKKKTNFQKVVGPESQILSKTEQSIVKCENNIKIIDAEIDNLGVLKKNNQLQISLAEQNAINSDNRIRQIDSSLVLVRQTIEDLQKKLRQAKQQQMSLLNNRRKIQSSSQAKKKVTQLRLKNNALQNQIKLLSDKNRQQTKACITAKNTLGQSKISNLQKQVNYRTIINQIEQYQKKMEELQKSVNDNNKTIQNLNLQNFKLKNQYTDNTFRLSQLDFKCKVALEAQRKKQTQLDQIINQINNLKNNSNQLSIRLINAQAEQSLANQTYNQIIQKLPLTPLFTVAPNAGSFTGSPIPERGIPGGPPFRITQILKGNYSVPLKSFNSYFNQRNIDPTGLLDTITKQKQNRNFDFTIGKNSENELSISFSSIKKQDNQNFWKKKGIQKFIQSQCDAKQQVSHQGIIQSIDFTSGTLTVKSVQDVQYLLSISPCTLMTWTSKTDDFAFKAGLKIYFEGVTASNLGGVVIFSPYLILISP